jgi:hypothetical protein
VNKVKVILQANDLEIEIDGKEFVISFRDRTISICSDPIVEYAKEHGISEEEAATEDILSDAFLTEKVLEGDKALREGSRLLNHEEVFGNRKSLIPKS